MKIYYGLNKLAKPKNPVVALGIFDGMHKAHTKILRSAVKKAAAIGGASVVLTFYPHPQRQQSIYSLAHRLQLMSREGIDIVIVLPFNKRLAHLSPEDFVKTIIVDKIDARYLYVGSNFRFGRDASAGPQLLAKLSDVYGFKVKIFGIIKSGTRPVSSTLIRKLITSGAINKAASILGRPVGIMGTVVRGFAMGDKLGFPTANIDPHHEILPDDGIYAVNVIIGGENKLGVCYIGRRPTFSNSTKKVVEVHILNFRKNIYGKDIEINFIKRIRGDMKFASSAALVKQIKKDLTIAKKIHSLQ